MSSRNDLNATWLERNAIAESRQRVKRKGQAIRIRFFYISVSSANRDSKKLVHTIRRKALNRDCAREITPMTTFFPLSIATRRDLCSIVGLSIARLQPTSITQLNFNFDSELCLLLLFRLHRTSESSVRFLSSSVLQARLIRCWIFRFYCWATFIFALLCTSLLLLRATCSDVENFYDRLDGRKRFVSLWRQGRRMQYDDDSLLQRAESAHKLHSDSRQLGNRLPTANRITRLSTWRRQQLDISAARSHRLRGDRVSAVLGLAR